MKLVALRKVNPLFSNRNLTAKTSAVTWKIKCFPNDMSGLAKEILSPNRWKVCLVTFWCFWYNEKGKGKLN